jgi:hypothetical protein
MSPVKPAIFELMLRPTDDGLGKKCYAMAKVTHEIGTFPNKRYFTTNNLRYIGLYTRNEQLNDSYRWYFQHPITQEEIFFDMKNPLTQWATPDATPAQKTGFIEVECYGNKIRSLQDLSRKNFKQYLNTLSVNQQQDFRNALKENQAVHEIISSPTALVKGGKKRKTMRKRHSRKSRKHRKKSVARRK